MTAKFDKFRNLLRELFQLDQADLDFGIYRIMNQKRDEVERFLDKDLLPQVKAAFEKYRPADKAALQAELDNTIADLTKYGVDPDTNETVLKLRQRLAKGVDVAALEDEVFSDLFTFFRRYYHGGDFLSLRRYKGGVYAIPYEGEEVKLHWANHDQYYIKSSEHLTNYVFKVGQRRVRLELVVASTERDNNKAQNGNERRFILADEEPVAEGGGDLLVRFEYRPDADKRAQDVLNAEAAARVLDEAPAAWKDGLARKAPTKANPDRTVLDKHLYQYTARNTFDYFIHKDLGGFLRRELDFFIKNEILLLDDIDHIDNFAKVEEKLSKVRVLRTIAHKIVAFLAQLEDFQKKLWLKKKFVVETNWCITLDRIPEEFYPEIAANDAQREEWVRLFAIDEIEENLVTPGYSVPLTVEFLKAHSSLVLDTAFFDQESIDRIAATLPDVGEPMGLLWHGDNFSAMALMTAAFQGNIDAAYIDPPYNTGKDGFPYKDNYKHSSWLSMMVDRLTLARDLLSSKGSLACSIDDIESKRLHQLLDESFGESNHVSTLIWNTEGHTDNQFDIKDNHEYVALYAKDPRELDIGHVVDPNTRAESNLWKGFAENSITKNGSANPPSEVTLPVGFPAQVATLSLPPNIPSEAFFEQVQRVGYITRKMTSSFDVTYPIRRDPLIAKDSKLALPCRVFSGWANARKLREFIDNGCAPLRSGDDETVFYLSGRGVLYYLKTRTRARNIYSVLRNMGTTERMSSELEEMGIAVPPRLFPKPKELIRYLAEIAMGDRRVFLDFFAGSGTTGQAIMEWNRETQGERRFILVEMGENFDRVILPRIMKNLYSTKWSGGKPTVRDDGVSQVVKYIRLESYEDALDNLELRERSSPQQQLLAASPEAREDYMLSYMLDVETQGSASLLNVEHFQDPFNYKLKVTRNGEPRVVTVDLVETFNYLIGLRVDHMEARVHRTAEFERDEHGRLQVKGGTRPCDAGEGWTFRVIQGRAPSDDRVLVIWRVLTDDPEKDNLMLDTFCMKMGFSTRDMEFDLIYVNGDNNLENLRRDQDTWKVQLIEESFHRLMFDVRDV